MKAIEIKLAKAKELLNGLEAQGAEATVINAQENVIKRLQKEADGINIPENATIKIKDGNGEIKSHKICRANFQRSIRYIRVQEFLNLFKANKYERAFPIIAITVAKAKSLGLRIFDFHGNDVTDTADESSLVVIDGQHRSIAAAILNDEGSEFCLENLVIKNELTNLAEYLSTIDGRESSNYSDSDRLDILAMRDPDDELTISIHETTKKGFSQSTSERILLRKPISRSKYSDAFINGKKLTTLLSDKEKESLNLERGIRLRDAFLAVGIEAKKISRYWIEGFNSYAIVNAEEQAFTALGKLKPEDIGKLSHGDDFLAILKKAFEIPTLVSTSDISSQQPVRTEPVVATELSTKREPILPKTE